MSTDDIIQKTLAQAASYAEAGDYVEAVRSLLALCRRGYPFDETAALFAAQGSYLYEMKLYERAIVALEQARRLEPTDRNTLLRLGAARQYLRDPAGALDAYNEVIALNPQSGTAHANKALALFELGLGEESLAAINKAVELEPNKVDGWSNRGIITSALAHYDEALRSASETLRLEPGHPGASLTQAQIYLLRGDFEAGWPAYAHRHGVRQVHEIHSQLPVWQGEPLAGKRIHVIPEQGFGDTIQFVRLTKLLSERGAEVVVSVPQRLLALVSQLDWISLCLVDTELPPLCDYQVLLLDLPYRFNIDASSIPLPGGYLQVPSLDSAFQKTLDMHRRDFNIGLVWRGNPGHAADHLRSMRLKDWEPLIRLDGVRLFSLQQNDPEHELMHCSWAADVVDLGSLIPSPEQTAAAMAALDLVITIDSFPAHLAGAHGLHAWVVLCCSPDWRWMLERDDSPWYDSLRLFRQREFGNWDAVVREVCQAIEILRG